MTFKCTFINNSNILRNFERRGEDTIYEVQDLIPDMTMTTIFSIERLWEVGDGGQIRGTRPDT